MLALRRLCLVACAVGGLCAPAAAQITASGGLRNLTDSNLRPYGLQRAWWSFAVTNAHRDKVLYMMADEDNLYLQSTNSVITAFDAETGRRLWATRMGTADRPTYAATSNDELLFAVNGTSMYAIQKKDGNLLWELRLPGQPTTSPVVDDRRIYVGFLDGSEYAFDLKQINTLFQQGKLPQWSYKTVLWRYRTSQPVVAPAVSQGRFVSFVSRNGSLYTVTKEERDLVFQFQTAAPLSAPMSRYRNSLLLASEDFSVYSLNMENGKLNWQFSTGLRITQQPIVVGDEMYLMPERGGMYKVAPQTGKQIWWVPRVNSVVSVSPNRVYGTDAADNLVIIDRVTGSQLGSVSLQGLTLHVTNDRSDRIFLASPTGMVVSMHEIGRDFATFHMYPERRPITVEFVSEAEDNAAEDMPDPAAEAEEAP